MTRDANNHSSAEGTSAALADVSSSIGAAVHSAHENLGEVAGKVGEAANQVTQQVRQQWDDGLACGREMKESLEKAVQAKPLAAIAVAAGAGLLLGLLLSRR